MFNKLKHTLRVAHAVIREHVTKVATRSGKWSGVRRAHLKANPVCAACGGKTRLQAHHKTPFNTNPALELDPANLITLCMGGGAGIGEGFECHLVIGHAGNFKMANLTVAEDSASALGLRQELVGIAARAKANRVLNAPEA